MSSNERIGGMLIFCVVLLVTFVSIFSVIPSELLAEDSRTYHNLTYPSDDWNGIDATGYAYRGRGFINDSYVDLAWLKINLKDDADVTKNTVSAAWLSPHHTLILQHTYEDVILWVFPFENSHDLTYYDNVTGSWDYNLDDWANGEVQLSFSEVNYFWQPNHNYSYMKARCPHGYVFNIYFQYNQTRYGNLTAAWDDYDLWIAIGQGYSDTFAKMDAWTVIGLLLTFQAPQIFGATGIYSTVLNLIIAMPIWAAIAYVFYRLILMAIPFVG